MCRGDGEDDEDDEDNELTSCTIVHNRQRINSQAFSESPLKWTDMMSAQLPIIKNITELLRRNTASEIYRINK
ncbi:MAG TPA: hypothetical protein DCZ55_13380 [Cyanobacteria bacterium UBA11371]|nr:hypothetical protein [Cyanobacteria bacterium UBA11371]HBE32418.1 hypothetical protein [Cyanobacteria bacterium UBA11368]